MKKQHWPKGRSTSKYPDEFWPKGGLDSFKDEVEVLEFIFKRTEKIWKELGDAEEHIQNATELVRTVNLMNPMVITMFKRRKNENL